MLATPLFGYVCDSNFSPWLVSATGSVLMFVCYMFLGPVPYLSFIKPTFGLTCGSLVAQGWKLLSCSQCQELGQRANLAPDWLPENTNQSGAKLAL